MASAGNASQTSWWTYPRIDNFGSIDPQGNYWKPDSNIQVPGNYPITAILPGTVTNVQVTAWGQTVVTIRLDAPVNSLATHTFYEHMSQATVSQGQHVNAGDLIGYNNPAGAVPLGFGLYSGDIYGSGSAWATLQSDLAPGGAGLLNPTKLLDTAKSGGNVSTSSNTSGCVGWNVPGIGCIGFPTNTGIGAWLSNPMRIIKMVIGIMIIGISLFMLVTEQPNVQTAIKAASKAAIAA